MVIEIRAWDKHERRMLCRGIFDRNWYLTPSNDEDDCRCVKRIRPNDKNELELMLYTGLKDLRGIKAFEKDFVKNRLINRMGIIEYSNEFASFYIADKKGNWICSLGAFGSDGFDIFSNVYESPKLLEEI